MPGQMLGILSDSLTIIPGELLSMSVDRSDTGSTNGMTTTKTSADNGA